MFPRPGRGVPSDERSKAFAAEADAERSGPDVFAPRADGCDARRFPRSQTTIAAFGDDKPVGVTIPPVLIDDLVLLEGGGLCVLRVDLLRQRDVGQERPDVGEHVVANHAQPTKRSMRRCRRMDALAQTVQRVVSGDGAG
jgi:hypothetical protein